MKVIRVLLSIIIFVFLCLMAYFYLNGQLDDFICNVGCERSERIPDGVEKEKIAIGIYKKSLKRCDCYIISRDIEKAFRDTMEHIRYQENLILERIKLFLFND